MDGRDTPFIMLWQMTLDVRTEREVQAVLQILESALRQRLLDLHHNPFPGGLDNRVQHSVSFRTPIEAAEGQYGEATYRALVLAGALADQWTVGTPTLYQDGSFLFDGHRTRDGDTGERARGFPSSDIEHAWFRVRLARFADEPDVKHLEAPLAKPRLTAEEAVTIARSGMGDSLWNHPYTVEYGSIEEYNMAREGVPIGRRHVWKITLTGVSIPSHAGRRSGPSRLMSTYITFVDDESARVLYATAF